VSVLRQWQAKGKLSVLRQWQAKGKCKCSETVASEREALKKNGSSWALVGQERHFSPS